jgi:ribosomal protein S18 acetylase RimI-like enzyme
VDVVAFGPEHVRLAAAIHAARFRRLRGTVPALTATFEDEDTTADLLADMAGVAAVEHGHLVGYLTARGPIARFRGTDRTGAHVPEWGHGVIHDDPAPVYRSMYAAAATAWAGHGCEVHAVSILAGDRAATRTWFEMGFGMLLVDAVVTARPPVAAPARPAAPHDAGALAALDREHVLHYGLPPTSMVPPDPMDETTWRAFLGRGRFGASIVERHGEPVGFMRFTHDHGGASLTAADGGAFVDGAYVRPGLRGRGLASALLASGLDELAARGVVHVALDYESTNPAARAFWPRWSTAACVSLQRITEMATAARG